MILDEGDLLALLTDEPFDDDTFDKMLDDSISNMLLLKDYPHIIDEDPSILLTIFRVWSTDAAAFSEMCEIARVDQDVIAQVHEECCMIHDEISELKRCDENVEEGNRIE